MCVRLPSGHGCSLVHQQFPTNEEGAMRINRKLAVAAGAAAIVAAGAGIATAGGEDAAEVPDGAITGGAITGDTVQKASEAALAETGGGRVTGMEVGDEESYYEVEVTRDDGSQVDVQLDESFAVVGSEGDDPGDDGGRDD